MSKIFISHSSRNNDWAIRVRDWLSENGWNDIFLDLDPQRGLVAGERWKTALQKAAHRCEVVIALVSAEWLASNWCRAELDVARLLNKKIMVCLIGAAGTAVPLDLTDEQWIDLKNDEHGFTRLKRGLNRAGLETASFAFPAGRRPYPGFAPLEEEDAAIYFGRDAQIVRALDKLRGLARAGVERMLVIVGASGAGKSSFLRAGLLPRLKRDDRSWLPLPVVRPERAAISGKFGLVESLHRVIADPAMADQLAGRGLPETKAGIQARIEAGGDAFVTMVQALREAAARPSYQGEDVHLPAAVLIVDQGEELFNDDGRAEACALLDLLSYVTGSDTGILVLVAMRSDALPQLQSNPLLVSVAKDTFTLDVMLEGSYRAVIEGPAKVVDPPLELDPELTDALLEDVAGQDALPLLAFTLANLYDRHRARNKLTLGAYRSAGGLKGIIQATVQRAIAEAVAGKGVPKDKQAQLALVRRAFIPHLARVNAAGQFVRRIAARSDIPVESLAIVDAFAEARLLVRDRRAYDGVEQEIVEVAHEALLREWPELNEALKDEREFLVAKAKLEQDVLDWRNAPAERKTGALLSGNRLARMRELLIGRAQDLSADEKNFITASLDHAARRRKLVQTLVAAAFVITVCLGALATWNWFQAAQQRTNAEQLAQRADRQLKDAQLEQSKFLADLAQKKLAEHDPATAVLLALEALPDAASPSEANRTRPPWPAAEVSLSQALGSMREDALLRGHTDAVAAVAVMADGKRALSGSFDGSARMWDLATGKELRQFKGHGDTVSSVASTADGRRVVTGSADRTARIWDGETGAPAVIIEGHTDVVRSVAISADGRFVVTGSEDHTARIWDATRGTQRAVLTGHDEGVNAVAISPDDRRIATGSSDHTIRIWDAASGKQIAVLSGHDAAVVSLSFSSDGAQIVSGSADGTARLWQREAGTPLAVFSGHGGWVSGVAIMPHRASVVTSSHDGTIRIWAIQSAKEQATFRGHSEAISSMSLSPDGQRIVTGSLDTTVRSWDASGGSASVVLGHASAVTAVQISSDGRLIVSASRDRRIRIWDALHGAAEKTLDGHDDLVSSLAMTADARRIVSGSYDRAAKIWDAGTGAVLHTLGGHGDAVTSVAITPDGGSVLSGSDDAVVRLWNGESGELVKELRGHTGAVRCVAFWQGKGVALTGADDNTVRIWNTATGEVIAVLKGHRGAVTGVAIANASNRIVTASRDGTARVWDAQTFEQLAVFKGHSDSVSSLAIAPNGDQVVTASRDRTAAVWDIHTGAEYVRLRGHSGGLTSVQIDGSGTAVATGAVDQTVRLWRLLPLGQPLVEFAKQAVARCLSPFERRQFFLSPTPPRWCVEKGKWPYDSVGAVVETSRLVGHGKEEQAHTILMALDADVNEAAHSARRSWTEAVTRRARGLIMAGRLAEATAFQTSLLNLDPQLLDEKAPGWNWWRVEKFANQMRDQGDPRGALLQAVGNHLALTPAVVQNDGINAYRNDLATIARPIAILYSQSFDRAQDATECDALAANPFDPMRVGKGVPFDKLDADAVIAVCTGAIAKAGDEARFYYLRARGYDKSAQAADKAEDKDLAVKQSGAMMADLRFAAEHNYPWAFYNLARAYEVGEGVEKDSSKAAALYLEHFNRVVACCAARVIAGLLNTQGLDQDQVRRVAGALLQWAAALGDFVAHRDLADLYLKGTLPPPSGANPAREAYRHFALAGKLVAGLRQVEAAQAAQDETKKAAAKLTANEIVAMTDEIAHWRKEPVTADPPWLRFLSASK